ncbi:MAG: metal ABC transporter permease [Planctomycetota bacterium]
MTLALIDFSIGLDLFPLVAALLAAVTCGVLGNFLVLRRLSLMGDAISHSVLPGLVIGFIVAGSRSPTAMFIGAAVAGVATVGLVELVKSLGRVEPGAAMGVVFSVLFALGVLVLESGSARDAHFDAECVLQGQLETLVWFSAPDSVSGLLSADTIEAVPRQVWSLAVIAVASFAFVIVLFKELRIAAFDPALATAQGFSATAMHYALMILVAAATVASFEAVGSILVIAMLVCPGATARLLADRLGGQIAWSVAIAVATAIGGYIAASVVPAAFGGEPVRAAGAMTVVGGGLLCVGLVFSPSQGFVARRLRRRRLARTVALEDSLVLVLRAESLGRSVDRTQLAESLPGRDILAAIREGQRTGLLELDRGTVRLTPAGRTRADDQIERNRSWSRYLVDEVGVPADHVPGTAEQLEHIRVGDSANEPSLERPSS